MIYKITIAFCLLFNQSTYAQQNIRKKVLEKGLIGRTFIFGKWDTTGKDETHLTYLGKTKTTKGIEYQFVNSIWYWGLSKRATSRILVFNGKNQYLGNYYLNTVAELPSSLSKGQLIFKDKVETKTDSLHVVSLHNGLPTQLIPRCGKHAFDRSTFHSN